MLEQMVTNHDYNNDMENISNYTGDENQIRALEITFHIFPKILIINYILTKTVSIISIEPCFAHDGTQICMHRNTY